MRDLCWIQCQQSICMASVSLGVRGVRGAARAIYAPRGASRTVTGLRVGPTARPRVRSTATRVRAASSSGSEQPAGDAAKPGGVFDPSIIQSMAGDDEDVKIPDTVPDFSKFGKGVDELGNQAAAVTKGNQAAVLERALDPDGGASDLDYLQELIAIQSGGPKNLGFFGTRNMGFLHQELVEILSYALVLTENHIFTSGATGTNAAVIRGALRAERPDLLTVILPQSLEKQPEESRELLEQVENVVERGEKDHLPLGEASRLCNEDIVGRVQQVICFAFHDSNTLLDTCMEAKMKKKIVTLFYLD